MPYVRVQLENVMFLLPWVSDSRWSVVLQALKRDVLECCGYTSKSFVPCAYTSAHSVNTYCRLSERGNLPSYIFLGETSGCVSAGLKVISGCFKNTLV